MQDKKIKCKQCSNEFIFTIGEQRFYATKGFANEPKRCKTCRNKRKPKPDPLANALGPPSKQELATNRKARRGSAVESHKDQPHNDESDFEPDWNGKCDNCGGTPIVPATGLCGPCSFGEADTIDGNW